MDYSEGSKIFYPSHGVGVIDKIEKKTILDVEHEYYIIRIINDDMKVMIPVDKADQLRLRPVIDDAAANKALGILEDLTEGMNSDWKVRFNANKEKIKTGSIFSVAEVVRDLFQRNKEKELSSSEKKLYESAYKLIVDEFSLKEDEDYEVVADLISEKLEVGAVKYLASLDKSLDSDDS